jgi:hypothetical protein
MCMKFPPVENNEDFVVIPMWLPSTRSPNNSQKLRGDATAVLYR